MLKKRPVIIKNLLSVTFGQLFSGLFWMGSIVLIARYLGVNGFGDFSYIMAYVNIFQFIADLGISLILIREVSRDKTLLSQYLGNLKSLYWFFSFFSVIIIILGIRLTTDNPDVQLAAYPAAVAMVGFFHVFSYVSVFRAFEEMEINSAGLVLSRLIFLLLVYLVIKYNLGLTGLMTVFALSSLLLWVAYYIIVKKKYIRPKLSFDLSTCLFMLKEGISLGGTIFLRKTLWYLDTFMLKALSNSFAVGMFNSIYQVVQIFYLIPWTLVVPFYPVFSRLFKSNPQQLPGMLNSMLKLSWAGTLPLAVWTFFIAQLVIETIYGMKFSQAADGLKIIIWTLPFLFPTALFFSFLQPSVSKNPTLSASPLPS
jgi:O-antigen/teichoic acid export membrane protein